MRIKKVLSAALALCALLLMPLASASAQTEQPYRVSLRRDFGYGAGMDIQGNMTLSLKGDESAVSRVSFLMDGEELLMTESEPFSFSFTTDDYPSGVHQLSARVETRDGKTFTTDALTYNFLSKEAASRSTRGIILPLIGLIGGVALLSWLLQYLTSRKKPQSGALSYNGFYGGAVCPKCGRPFARSLFGMNMVAGRLERCPHCGKWSLTRRASLAELEAAEAALRASVSVDEAPAQTRSEMQDLLDDSRYYDPSEK
ncbi:MAG: Ig-like domain-containing protein [Anaerolineaceae bacterium]